MFFSCSTNRTELLEKKFYEISGALKLILKNLSQTRCVVRSEYIDSVWISLEKLLAYWSQMLIVIKQCDKRGSKYNSKESSSIRFHLQSQLYVLHYASMQSPNCSTSR